VNAASAQLGLDDAQRLAAAIGPLPLVRARARAGRQSGEHPRRASGAGSEFWQYRTLQAGEPSDKIDWRRSARSDDLFVREREREDPVRLWLWVDGSASMDFASDERMPTKAAAARVLVTAIALAAAEAGETCLAPPAPSPVRPARIYEALGSGGNRPHLPALGPADVVLAAGDFLDEGTLDWAAEAASRGASGLILAVQDRAEIDFPYSGRVRFDAVEADEVATNVGRAEAIRDTYVAAWTAHEERLRAAGDRPGWAMLGVRTDEPLDGPLGRAASWLGTAER
jgi:uncharacterized protein (DUF58 family)